MIIESFGNLRDLPWFNQTAIVLINFITIALLLTVANHNRFKDIKSRLFLLMGLFILLWVDFAYLARVFGRYPLLATVFLKVAWVATPLLFFSTYLTSIHLFEQDKKYKQISKFLLGLSIVLSVITAFTSLIIAGTQFSERTFFGLNTLTIIYGIAFYPFLFGVFLIMFFTILPIKDTEKMNYGIKYFLFGVIIFYVANLIFNIILPVFFNIPEFYYFGDYSTIILLIFTSYAILRHGLFNIKVVTTELLTLVIWSILFSKLFVTQSYSQFFIDLMVFVLMIIFGVLLIRSVIKETEQREELEKLTERLKFLDKQKDEFVSMAAHELRAPMTAIKGYLSMVLEGDAGELTPKARGFIAETSTITDRLTRLVNNMLNVSRIEEGRLVYQIEFAHLTTITQMVYSQFKIEAERKGLEIILDVQKDLKDLVKVDVDRIQEVMSNFVSNAVKYTDQGEVVLRLKQAENDTWIRFEVQDTGPGISKEEQKKLFQKFYRAESNVGKTIGTGLGLYICKLLINNFNGKLGLVSDTGKGSLFWFELPLVNDGGEISDLPPRPGYNKDQPDNSN